MKQDSRKDLTKPWKVRNLLQLEGNGEKSWKDKVWYRQLRHVVAWLALSLIVRVFSHLSAMPSGHTNSCLQLFNLRSAAELLAKERKKEEKERFQKDVFNLAEVAFSLSLLSRIHNLPLPSTLPHFPLHPSLAIMTYIVLSVTMFHDMTLPYCKSVLS